MTGARATLSFRNAEVIVDGDITKISGELLNIDHLVARLLPQLLVNEGFLQALEVIVAGEVGSSFVQHMTPDEIMAVFERFVPPSELE